MRFFLQVALTINKLSLTLYTISNHLSCLLKLFDKSQHSWEQNIFSRSLTIQSNFLHSTDYLIPEIHEEAFWKQSPSMLHLLSVECSWKLSLPLKMFSDMSLEFIKGLSVLAVPKLQWHFITVKGHTAIQLCFLTRKTYNHLALTISKARSRFALT